MARSRLPLFQNGCSGLERPSAIKWRQTVAGVAVVAELIFRRPDDPSDLSNFYGNQALASCTVLKTLPSTEHPCTVLMIFPSQVMHRRSHDDIVLTKCRVNFILNTGLSKIY